MAARTGAPGGNRARSRSGAGIEWELDLLESWSLRRRGVEIPLRRREQRLLALLALHGARPRQWVAGILWPDSTEVRAAGSLRAAVWHIDQAAPELLVHDRSRIALHARTRIDVRDLVERATEFRMRSPYDADDKQFASQLRLLLRGELLPGWYDDWVIFERNRVQHLCQHALEQLADQLVERGDVASALQAALAAVAIEPLRESAQRSLIRAEISAGNYSDAVRQYAEFRARIASELGVEPSEHLESLVRPLLERRLIRARTAT